MLAQENWHRRIVEPVWTVYFISLGEIDGYGSFDYEMRDRKHKEASKQRDTEMGKHQHYVPGAACCKNLVIFGIGTYLYFPFEQNLL